MAGGKGITGRVATSGGDTVGTTVGLVLPTFPQSGPLDAGRLRTTIADAESAGVDALWACDHLFWHGPVLEALTTLAVAAGATTRCTLGTAVLQLALRQPAVVAKTAAALQELSGGRLVLGVGAGAHAGEFAASGVDFDNRGRALDGALDELARLWSPGDERYAQRPAPPPVPIWVGGSGDRAVRRAARHDGWIPMFLSPESLRARYRQLDAEVVLAGRQPDEVARSVLLFVRTGPDGGQARRQGLAWMSSLYGLPEARLERHLVAGEPAACVDRLAAYAEAGARHLCLFVADDDPVPHVDALLPALRTATARSSSPRQSPTVTAPATATPASTARTVHP